MANQVKSNVARYKDKKGNRSIVYIEEAYSSENKLEKIIVNFIGVDSSHGEESRVIYDFKNKSYKKSVNGSIVKEDNNSSEEKLKAHLLHFFNDNDKITLSCTKKDCVDPKCRPIFKAGNKMFGNENAKAPYFTSTCNTVAFNETEEHLQSKVKIYQYLRETQSPYIRNVQIEKTLTSEDGTYRRADVYYEKLVKGEFIPIAIEIQRNNISEEEFKERTEWYKREKIAPFWIIVDKMFSPTEEKVNALSKKNFNFPLLKIMGACMQMYTNRFFVYDSATHKVLALTVYQDKFTKLTTLPEKEKEIVMSNFSVKNLFLISNTIEENGKYKVLSYKEHRLDSIKDIGSSIIDFDVFYDDKTKIRNAKFQEIDGKKGYEFKKILSLGEMTMKNLLPKQAKPKLI
jgi:hypothetical protein